MRTLSLRWWIAESLYLSLLLENSSFLRVVDINWEAIFVSSSSLFKSLVIQFFSTKTGHSHVTRLVGQVLVAQFAWTLLQNSIVEWLWLIELFSVLRSILIGVSVSLSGPACAVPERRVHDVAGAIINKRLSGSVEIGLVLDVLVDLDCFLLWEFPWRITSAEHRFRLWLRVNITSTESRLIWCVLRMIMRMGLRHCLGTISSWGGIESIIRLWNPLSVESNTIYKWLEK